MSRIDDSRDFLPVLHRRADGLGTPAPPGTIAPATRWWNGWRRRAMSSPRGRSFRRTRRNRRPAQEWCHSDGIDVILSTGGTGLTGRT